MKCQKPDLKNFTDVRLRLYEYAANHTMEELLRKTIDELEALTESSIGFFHFVESDQKTLSLQAWSTRTTKEFCKAEGKGMHYPIDKAGVWVDCVRSRQPVVHNDYSSLPHRKGVPPGHASVIREMVVPVIKDERVVAVLGVGNKPSDYTLADITVAEFLADVTWRIVAQKKTEESLRISEKRFSTIFHASPVAIALSQADDNRLVEVNHAWQLLTGYTREEAIGHTAIELGLWVAPDQRKQIIKKPLGNKKTRWEVQMRRKSGQILHLLMSAEVVTINGKSCFLALAQDITDRIQMENSLLIAAQEWQITFDATRSAIWILDKEQRVIRSNKTAEGVFQVTADRMLGKHCWEIVHGTRGPIPECPILRARRSLRRESMELLIGDRWFDVTVDPILDEEGRFEGAIHIVSDITKRKQVEDVMRQNAHIVSSSRDMLALVDGNFIYLCANEAYTKAFGKSPQEIIGMTVADLFGTEIFDTVLRPRAERCLKGVNVHYREWFEFPADGRRYMDITYSPYQWKDGDIRGFIVSARDITEFESLRMQLIQAQKMESIGRLAGGVAHDFNNLLSIIMGYGELLLGDLRSDHPHRQPLQDILDAAIRAKDLTRQLLAFSRKQMMIFKTIDLNDVVSGLDRLLRRVIGEDIKLILSVFNDPLTVEADVAQLEQLLMNLAVNARDAMLDGGALTIETIGAFLDETYTDSRPGMKPGEYAVIIVSDTGCGMDKETLSQIFEPFFTTKSKEKGTGLGLAMSYGIVKQHGGYIWVYSEPDYGTTFRIYLPLSTRPLSIEPQRSQQHLIAEGSATVLVVEDDVTVRRLAVDILKHGGYRVVESDSVQDAIEKAARHDEYLHLVLTDVVMPDMKGPAVFSKIAEHHPEAQVLYMSGYTDDVIVHQGILKEGIPFIQKPFTVKSLLEKVRHVLSR